MQYQFRGSLQIFLCTYDNNCPYSINVLSFMSEFRSYSAHSNFTDRTRDQERLRPLISSLCHLILPFLVSMLSTGSSKRRLFLQSLKCQGGEQNTHSSIIFLPILVSDHPICCLWQTKQHQRCIWKQEICFLQLHYRINSLVHILWTFLIHCFGAASSFKRALIYSILCSQIHSLKRSYMF